MVWAFVALVLLAIWAVTSRRNADIGELGICLSPTSPPLNDPTVAPDVTPYLCGTISGNSDMGVLLELFHEGQFVDDRSTYLQLGSFSEPVPSSGDLQVGDYEVRVRVGTLTVGEVGFRVAGEGAK